MLWLSSCTSTGWTFNVSLLTCLMHSYTASKIRLKCPLISSWKEWTKIEFDQFSHASSHFSFCSAHLLLCSSIDLIRLILFHPAATKIAPQSTTNKHTGHAYLYHEGEDRVRMIRMLNFKGEHDVEEPPSDDELKQIMAYYEESHKNLLFHMKNAKATVTNAIDVCVIRRKILYSIYCWTMVQIHTKKYLHRQMKVN